MTARPTHKAKRTTMAVLALVITSALVTPSQAFYTECAVRADTDLVNRPNGTADPRLGSLEKGAKVGFRDSYRDEFHREWWFVVHWEGDRDQYGWVLRTILRDCHGHEGTP